jgi:CDP-diglyceride synthetase
VPAALGTRTLSSVLVVAVAALLVYGPPPLFTLLLLGLAWLGVAEMYGMLSADGAALPAPLGVVLVTPPILAGALGGRDAVSLSVLLAGVAPLLWAMAGGPRPEALRQAQRWTH